MAIRRTRQAAVARQGPRVALGPLGVEQAERRALDLTEIAGRGDLLRGSSLEQIRGPLDVVQRSSLTTGPLDIVQQASEESFPASDAPTYSQPEPTRSPAPSIPPEQG